MTAKSDPLITLTSDLTTRSLCGNNESTLRKHPDGASLTSHPKPAPRHLRGSVFLANTLPFSAGTIHLAVVDPLSVPAPSLLRTRRQRILVCPDNGLPTIFLHDIRRQDAYFISHPHVCATSQCHIS
jgi:S-adenosylmethionine hydrolase